MCIRDRHKEKLAALNAAWRATHKEEMTAQRATYRAAHKEELAALNATWRAAHTEEIKARSLAYYQANKEICVNRRRRRRARSAQAEGTHTAADIKAQYARQRGKCFWCGVKVGKAYHVDHVVPLSRGGSNWPENLVIACATCNMQKGAKLPHEWAKGGRLL